MAMSTFRAALFVWLVLAIHGVRTDEEDGNPSNPIFNSTKDHRRNLIGAAIAETLWSVRVIKASTVRNTVLNFSTLDFSTLAPSATTNMDLLWAWVSALRAVGLSIGDVDFDKAGGERNDNPATFAAATQSPAFKEAMDKYMDSLGKTDSLKAVIPDCSEATRFSDRVLERKQLEIFTQRGRIEADDNTLEKHGLLRKNSMINMDAGIAPQEAVPPEARHFFSADVPHDGKSKMLRVDDEGGQLYADLGAPFCAGASGTIFHMLLSMENNLDGKAEQGLVPCSHHPVREALLGIRTATLIATGHHSLAECLAVAQGFGYFKQVTSVLKDYKRAAGEFEEYLAEHLGVSVGQGEERPLVARMGAS